MARKGDGIYKRGNAWRLDCYINGQRWQLPLGKGISLTVAREIATAKRAAILRGEAGIGRKRHDIAFDKASEEFLAAAKVRVRPNTYRSYQQHLAAMKEVFADTKLSKISPLSIGKYKQKRVADDVKSAFNRELGTLKTMFNWCMDNGKFNGTNPTRKIKRLEESPGRERALTVDEEKRLLDACALQTRVLFMCGIYAGLRIPSEVLNLTWADVDLNQNQLTVRGAYAKNGKTATVPITPILKQGLIELKFSKAAEQTELEALVFTRQDGKPYKSIQNIFRTAAKRAGVSDVSPHVCRHTFATRLAELGVDLRTIQELGRWASLAMVQRYSNISERHKAEAVKRLSYAGMASENSKPLTLKYANNEDKSRVFQATK